MLSDKHYINQMPDSTEGSNNTENKIILPKENCWWLQDNDFEMGLNISRGDLG